MPRSAAPSPWRCCAAGTTVSTRSDRLMVPLALVDRLTLTPGGRRAAHRGAERSGARRRATNPGLPGGERLSRSVRVAGPRHPAREAHSDRGGIGRWLERCRGGAARSGGTARNRRRIAPPARRGTRERRALLPERETGAGRRARRAPGTCATAASAPGFCWSNPILESRPRMPIAPGGLGTRSDSEPARPPGRRLERRPRWASFCATTLQPGCLELQPHLAQLLQRLSKLRTAGVLMSGSGSTCFAAFGSRSARDAAVRRASRRRPAKWSFSTQAPRFPGSPGSLNSSRLERPAMNHDIKIFSGNSNLPLVGAICETLRIPAEPRREWAPSRMARSRSRSARTPAVWIASWSSPPAARSTTI